ncbi:MAG: RDD family protein [Fuerstiella sp.]
MNEKLKVDARVTVETPEGVDFQFVIAGPGKRGVSFVVDLLLKLGVIVLAFYLIGVISVFTQNVSGVGVGFFLLTWFAMSWLYGSCCEAFLHGQTLGKRWHNLRVVRTNGTPIGWFEAFGRNLLLVADSFLVLGPFALNTVGLLSMTATKRMQRLGDLVFDTMVIDESREYISRASGITHGVEAIPRQDCQGRYHLPERTLAVIERLFEGDRLISDGRREEIARPLSLTLRRWLGYEEPGPDPRNPNTYFAQAPQKHTAFLKRILKTFAEDNGIDPQSAETEMPSGRLKPRRTNGEGNRLRSSTAPAPASTAAAAAIPERSAVADEAQPDFFELTELEAHLEVETETEPDDDDRGGLPADWRTSS